MLIAPSTWPFAKAFGIGREFSLPLLAAVANKPEADLASALDRLAAPICVTFFASPSRSSRATSEACRLAGTA